MLQKHLASVLLGLGAISPFVAQADQPANKMQSSNAKSMPQFDQGEVMVSGQPGTGGYVPAAYNYPANYKMAGQTWDVYLTGSFTYWKAHQDNMFTGVATNASTPDQVDGAFEGTNGFDLDNQVLFSRKPSYKPGFKVGLGMNAGSFDNWTVYGEYTWFHPGDGKDDADDDCGECGCATQILIVPNCACPGDQPLATDLESKWKIDMDIGDITVGRPAYQGKRLVLNPFFGVRGLWLRQKWDVEYDGIANEGAAILPLGEYETKAHSKSWAVGPRVGMDGSWLLGCGFRIIGNASASLLYTRYTSVTYQSNISNDFSDTNPAPISPAVDWKYAKSYGTVRPNAEIDAGFGWGMYIGDDFHLDFAATYDFHVFWNQNMVQNIANWAVQSVDAAPGNLYLHGLTIKARFDF